MLRLAEPGFVAAVARAGGARGRAGQTEAMRAVAGGIPPDALIDRRDKAIFNAVSSARGAAIRARVERARP